MQSEMNLKSIFISLFPNINMNSMEKAALSMHAVRGPSLRTEPCVINSKAAFGADVISPLLKSVKLNH